MGLIFFFFKKLCRCEANFAVDIFYNFERFGSPGGTSCVFPGLSLA